MDNSVGRASGFCRKVRGLNLSAFLKVTLGGHSPYQGVKLGLAKSGGWTLDANMGDHFYTFTENFGAETLSTIE